MFESDMSEMYLGKPEVQSEVSRVHFENSDIGLKMSEIDMDRE